ncbi:MAG: hypothetical protein A2138_20775 [Deltaproteobacteria bacterium RBG_16_71_12]|nr:MAG: hypothetical protein A2138_20775 [Deltaproteobacteria bacterium RBG_16_71_12]
MAKVRVYVDAFNVYYGALKNRGAGTKWLDLRALVGTALRSHSVDRVVYCTARVSDPQTNAKQDRYLRALAARGGVDIVEGTYKMREKSGTIVSPPPPPGYPPGNPGRVRIRAPEEKGSDVNLASRLLIDAYEGRFDEAIVMSLDTDLAMPISHVTHHLKKAVGLLVNADRANAAGVRVSTLVAVELRKAAKYCRRYTEVQVRASQLPDPVIGPGGAVIAKPVGW